MKGSKGSPSLMKRMVEGLSSKTNELRARIMIFFLLHKGLQPGSISHKLHALLGGRVHLRHHKKHDQDLLDRQERHELLQQPEDHESEVKKESAVHPLAYCNNYGNINDNDVDDPSSKAAAVSEIVEENGPYYYDNHHDLNKLQDGVEMVKEEEELAADDNIDQAADLFIKRFRQQIWPQKQLSSCEFNRGADTTTMISTL